MFNLDYGIEYVVNLTKFFKQSLQDILLTVPHSLSALLYLAVLNLKFIKSILLVVHYSNSEKWQVLSKNSQLDIQSNYTQLIKDSHNI